MTVDTDGMELYDKGEEKAWKELFLVFAGEKEDVILGRIGILGMTPQDISDLRAADRIRERFAAEGKTAVCFGMGNGLDDVKSVSNVAKKYRGIAGRFRGSEISGTNIWNTVRDRLSAGG